MAEKLQEDWPLSHSFYGKWYKEHLDTFQEGLWKHLEAVPALEPQTRDAVMRYLLELACQAQNITNITLGRQALLALPRDWLVQNIEQSAEFLLEVKDEWEYRRLLEIYEQLDDDLVHRLVVHGLASADIGIREAAQEWAEENQWMCS